ncbi:MAG: outer membrane protein assembly factor BamD [bacterium]
MNIRNLFRTAALLLVLASFLVQGSCFWKKKNPEKELPANVLYQQGLELIQKKKFNEAREAFNKAKVSSKETNLELLAQIAVADSYFEEEEYEAAGAQYEEIFKLHSGGETADYLQYRIGECSFWQIDTIDRDTTHAKEALKAYNLLTDKFPKSEYLQLAGLRVKEIHTFLAESEFFIGEFYLRKSALFAAINRFKKTLELYPDSGIEDKLLFYLYKSYTSLKDDDHAEEYRKLLIERFPNSEYVPMASLGKKQGIEHGFEGLPVNRQQDTEPSAAIPLHDDSAPETGTGDSRQEPQDIAQPDKPQTEKDQPSIGIAGTYQKDKAPWYRRIFFPGAGTADQPVEAAPDKPSAEPREDLEKRSFFDKLFPW